MDLNNLISLGPIIGGAVLLAICFVSIIRNPAVSNTYALLLAFGALLFAVPIFANFTFKGASFEVSAQVATRQVETQGAEIKGELENIRRIVAAIAQASGASAALTASPANVEGKRKSTVIIVYSDTQKALAQQIEQELLAKGFAANAVYSDYSELETSKKGPIGSIRFVYTSATQAVADSVKKTLQSETSKLTPLSDEVRAGMPSDLRILLF
jgi:hypothetical protein